MKKAFPLFLTICFVLCTGCHSQSPVGRTTDGSPAGSLSKPFEDAVDNYPGIKLVVVDGTATSTSAEVKIVNESGFGMSCYGDNYIRVQKEQDGIWYDMTKNNIPVTSQGPWMFDANVEYRETVKWEAFYGTLSPGHYRIVKSCSVRTDSETILLLLTAEFDVK